MKESLQKVQDPFRIPDLKADILRKGSAHPCAEGLNSIPPEKHRRCACEHGRSSLQHRCFLPLLICCLLRALLFRDFVAFRCKP